MLKNSLSRLRLVGYLEGASFLLLLGVAMPLKYLADMPEMVRVMGSAHGLLFLLYIAAVANAASDYRWPFRRILAALVASVLPGGPFVFERRLRAETASTPLASAR